MSDERLFRETNLYVRPGKDGDADDDYVTSVHVPIMNPPPEAIWWGQRLFVRREDGRYVEGMCWVIPAEPPH